VWEDRPAVKRPYRSDPAGGPDANRLKRQFLEYHLPVFIWLLATFFFSTDAFSSNETSRVIVPVLTYLFPAFSLEQIDFWHLAIRKLGHISEYFILATLSYRCFRLDGADPSETRLKTIVFVLLAALADEWHQSFTAFRGPSIVDVGYDCFGAVWALWLITFYETWRLRSHSVL
jgi:VanZ family protein